MKWLRDNWFILLVIGAAVFFFWEWQCNKPKVNSVEIPVEDTVKTKNLEHDADSLRQIVGDQMASVGKLNDSLSGIKKIVFGLRQEVKDLNTPDPSAIISMDSAGYNFLLSRCDSLGEEFGHYVIISEQKENTQDSIISNQVAIISSKDSLVITKQQFNDMLLASFKSTRDGFAKIDKNYQKQLQWQKVKQKILVGVIIAEAAKIVYDSSRK